MAKAGGPNTTIRLIDIGANGAGTKVYATGPTRGWRVFESVITAGGANNAPQGFQIKIPNDNSASGFTTWFARAADVPFDQRNFISEHAAYGEVFAGPGNATPGLGIGATAATLLCIIQSATATATTIEIVEEF
jgi:hypothetical protein